MIAKLENNNITLCINGHQKISSVNDIPVISERTKAIFQELGTEVQSQICFPLKEEVKNLANILQNLQIAKDHCIRDKFFALLRSVLAVAIVAGAFFAILAAPPVAAVFIGLAAYILYSFLACYNASQACPERKKEVVNWGILFIINILSPFLPIYECFTKIAKLEDSEKMQRNTIDPHFAIVADFFKKNHNQLLKGLAEKIQEVNQALVELQKLNLQNKIHIPADLGELVTKKDEYIKAESELKIAQAFYSKF
jgi:hypothetical protein